MENELNQSVQVLNGLELSKANRAANMQCFHFGVLQTKNKKNVTALVGEFALHIQCPWRLADSQEILVGSDDLYEQPTENADYNPNFDWDKPMANLRDVKLQRLLDSNQFTVIAVVADNYGGLEIKFNAGISLALFPTITSKDEFLEYWRLINNKEKAGSHLVVGPSGAEEIKD